MAWQQPLLDAMLDMPCRVYMGAKDVEHQSLKRLPYAFDGRRSDSCTKVLAH